MTGNAHFDDLPADVLSVEILSALSPEAISGVAAANKIFHRAAKHPLLWKKKCAQHFPHLMGGNNGYKKFHDAYRDEYKTVPLKNRKLFSFVKENDVDNIKKEVTNINLLDLKDKNNISLLEWAHKKNNPVILSYFYQLVKKAKVKKDKLGRTLLYWAIACHQLEMVKALLAESPVLLNQVDNQGRTPLLTAILYGQRDIAKFIISQKPDLDRAVKDKYAHKTALYLATENEDAELVALLVGAGAHPTKSVFGDYAKSLLNLAVERGSLALVKAYIETRADLLDFPDVYGQTPLMCASVFGRADIAAYLLRKGARLDVAINCPGSADHGKSPLYLAKEHGHKEVFALLSEAARTVSAALDKMIYQPIHIAAREGHLDVVKAAIKANPTLLNQADGHHKTPLDWAVSHGRSEVLDFLLMKGAKSGINKPNVNAKLSVQAKAKLDLLAYLAKRATQADYKKTLTLFGYTFFKFGFSKQQKLGAAEVLKKVFIEGDETLASTLSEKKELNNGDLKRIYRRLKG